MQSTSLAPEGDISSTRYEHMGAHKVFLCQAKPTCNVCKCFKIPVHAVHYQAIYPRVNRDGQPWLLLNCTM